MFCPFLGKTYKSYEIEELLSSYIKGYYTVQFLKDRYDMKKVLLEYSYDFFQTYNSIELEPVSSYYYKGKFPLKFEKLNEYRFRKFSVLYGEELEDKEGINWQVNAVKITFEKLKDLLQKTAFLIAQGKICGWFCGRSEFGPRALGARSILADPRNPEIKDILNQKVKHRENFRPFAPAILYEYQHEFFDLQVPSPYMLFVAKVKPEKANLIPGVIHVDNTARLQSVFQENGRFYQLIKEFMNLTGIPVLLNTSFNVAGEPIVETPQDAFECFLNTHIDFLVLEDYMVFKNEQTDI